jgi:hypothetical protein
MRASSSHEEIKQRDDADLTTNRRRQDRWTERFDTIDAKSVSHRRGKLRQSRHTKTDLS